MTQIDRNMLDERHDANQFLKQEVDPTQTAI